MNRASAAGVGFAKFGDREMAGFSRGIVVGYEVAARRLVWRKELVHALGFGGFSPPRQQGDGREQQTNENDFLHVLDRILCA
jgi:surfactin synthase thioesterase subunit